MLNYLGILRVFFIAILFLVFGWQFAYPSVKKFVQSGVLTDKSWQRRKTEDSPAITLCALNKATSFGWKDGANDSLMMSISAFEMFCNQSTSSKDRIENKIEKKTGAKLSILHYRLLMFSESFYLSTELQIVAAPGHLVHSRFRDQQ